MEEEIRMSQKCIPVNKILVTIMEIALCNVDWKVILTVGMAGYSYP
jgi:hypothetical protein